MSSSSDKSFNCKNNSVLVIKAMFILLPKSVIIPPVRPFMYSYNLKVSSRWLHPHAYNAGMFEKMCVITLDPTSWSIKEVIARRTRQPDYIALTLSLSHRSFTVGLLYSPRYLRVHPNTVPVCT